MTVPSTKFREDYAGNGSATSFPYAFRIFKATDLVVTKTDNSGNETTLTLGTNYTVTGAGSYNGGAVVLTTALPTSYRLTIERVLAIRQDTDLRNQGEFLAETHEDAFDRLTMIVQRLAGYLGMGQDGTLRTLLLGTGDVDGAGAFRARGNRISGLGNPVSGQDAVTKAWFDQAVTTSVNQAANSAASAAASAAAAEDSEQASLVIATQFGDMATAVTQTEAARDTALSAKNAAQSSATSADTSATSASTAKSQAEAARDAAQLSAGVYADTAAGIAAVADGSYFSVPDALSSNSLILYRRAGPAALEITRYPSSEYVSKVSREKISTATKARSTEKTFAWSVKTIVGQILLGLDRSFRLHVGSLKLLKPATKTGRTTRGAVFSIADSNGKRAFAILEDGKAWFRPAKDVLDYISAQLSITGRPTFRGDANARDVWGTTELIHARLSDGAAWHGEVRQLAVGVDAALASVDQPMLGIHAYGQSNAGGGGTAAAALTTPLYIRHCFNFSGSHAKYGDTAANGSALSSLTPAFDSGQPYIDTSTAFAAAEIGRQRGDSVPPMLVRTDWYGGQPLSTFVRGTTSWNNLLVSIERGRALAKDYGFAYLPAILWVQGESGPYGRTAYRDALKALIADLRAEVKAQNGILPPFLFWQISWRSASDPDSGVMLGQLDVSKSYDGGSVVCVGPTYSMPVVDGIHYSAEGRMMQGEVTALALRSIKATGTFRPLQPRSISLAGNKVVIDYEAVGAGVSVDSDWIELAANFGFSYADDSGSASISSVAITGKYQVTVTLSAVPTGANKKIRYAIAENSPSNAKWLKQRGQIYSSSGTPSVYAARGYAVPADIRFYSVAFEEILA